MTLLHTTPTELPATHRPPPQRAGRVVQCSRAAGRAPAAPRRREGPAAARARREKTAFVARRRRPAAAAHVAAPPVQPLSCAMLNGVKRAPSGAPPAGPWARTRRPSFPSFLFLCFTLVLRGHRGHLSELSLLLDSRAACWLCAAPAGGAWLCWLRFCAGPSPRRRPPRRLACSPCCACRIREAYAHGPLYPRPAWLAARDRRRSRRSSASRRRRPHCARHPRTL